MEALKLLLLLCLWYEHASTQTTGISANCSVTIVNNSPSVTLNSSGCTMDGEICRSFEFEVEASYIGNNITLMINSSSDGIFCCRLDRGTCIRCASGFQFTNVSAGPHIIMVEGASVAAPQLSTSVTLEIPEFTVAADVLGSTITLLICPDTDSVFRCRLDDNDLVNCSNGSQFRGVSAGEHFIEVEKIDGVNQSITIDVPESVVSFSNLQVDVDQVSQNYTFTFTITGESSNLIFNLLIDSIASPVPYTCNRIADNDHSCSFLLPESSNVSVGYHYITIQRLLDEVVYGETTKRFLVFKQTTITFKESNYVVKEDDGVFNVTVQKFGETTESLTVFIRTRAANPTSATPGTDYVSTQEMVIFEAGTTSEKKAEITVVPDDVLELNETYILLLFIRSGTLNRLNLVLMDNTALVTIVNDDNVTVSLRSQVKSVVEGNGYVASISIEPTDLMTSFNVTVETYSCGGCIGANPETDYTPISRMITFGPGDTSEEINITVLEDIFTESDEEVVCIRLVLPESSQAAGVLLNSSSNINFTITDDNENLLNLSFNAVSISNQGHTRYTINVTYSASQQATTFNCHLNDQNFSLCSLPHVYTDLYYDVHTVTVQAQSDSSNVTIVQKVLMVMAEIGIIDGTTIVLHIRSTLPAMYRCRLNDGQYFSCSDQQVITNLSRGNYILTTEAVSIDNSALMAFEYFDPVFLFGPDIVEEQSTAVKCSGSASYFSMGVSYTALWRAREDKVDFELVANTSQQWLSIGFTDKQMLKFDFIVGATDNNGTYFVDDRNLIEGGEIVRDSEQDVEDISVVFNNSITTVRFSRKKVTGDEDDFSLDACRYFLFAWGDVTDIITGEIDTDGMMQRFISDELICLPTSTLLCPEIFDCGEPEKPLNGTVQVVENNTLEGGVAIYNCDDGHLLIGESQRMCTSKDSIWSGVVPECRLDCGHPGTPSNGNSDFNSTTLGAIVMHSCDSGYVLCNGSESRSCQPDMSWSGKLPDCIRVMVMVDNSVNYTVNEANGAVNITLKLDKQSCRPISITAYPQVRLTPDATADDFDNTSVPAIVDPGEITALVSISIIDDNLLELIEYFDVFIEIEGTDTDGAILGQPRETQVAIISEDVVMVTFTESEYNESEGAGSMRIGVQLSRTLQQMITVQVVTTGITAQGSEDFDSTTINVNISPAIDTVYVLIPIIDNSIVEDVENFSLSIQIPPEFVDIGVRLGTLSMATGFIIDDDVDCGSLEDPENGQVDFTDTFGGSVANYSCNETYVLCGTESIICQSNGSWSALPDCIRVEVTVDDRTPYIVNENESLILINLLLNRPSCHPITIIANLQERPLPSATVDDFNSTLETVIVKPGDTEATVTILITDDDLLEAAEFFNVEFSIGGTDTAGAVIGEPGEAEITILSEDVITVSFTQSVFNVSEGAGTMKIGVTLSKTSPQEIVLQLVITPITAEGNGVDIDSNNRSIVFELGNRTVSIDIPINDDDIFEPLESVKLSIHISPELMNTGINFGLISEATGNIIDDEADCGIPDVPTNGMVSYNSTVEGSMAVYTCDEGYILEGVIQRTCEESGQWSGNVPQCQPVNCSSPSTPNDGEVIGPSTTFGSVVTHICNTGFVLCGEMNRTCQSNGLWTGAPPNCTMVTVTVPSSDTVNENEGQVDIVLRLDQPSCIPITIIAHPQVRTVPSATSNDFDNASISVIISPGETTATVSIPIINDDLLEGLEIFNVVIEIGADIDSAVVEEPGITQVVIANDDVIIVSFTEREYNVSEGAGVMTVGIELNRPSPQRLTLQLEVTPNTAQGNGIDIDSSNQDIIFELGSIITFLNISINDDSMVEPTENFTLTIQFPMGIGITLGINGVGTGFIVDDDVDCGRLENPTNGQVNFITTFGGSVANYTCNQRYVLCGTDSRTCQSNGSWSGSAPECILVTVTVPSSDTVNENEGQVDIVLRLDQPSCIPITIIAHPQVRTVPSATSNDFDNTSISVIISPGETTATVSIPIINDDLLEGLEIFNVVIEIGADTDGVVVEEPGITQVVIANDDVIIVSFTEREYNVSEGAGVMTVGIELNRPSPQRLTLQLEVTPNTAQGNGIDIDSSNQDIIFELGSIITFLNISINDDSMVEPTENFTLTIQFPIGIGITLGINAIGTGFIVDDDVDCGRLENPTNGQVNFITTFEGSVANYTCNRRYLLCGTDSRTCQSNGSWSESAPECIRVTVTVDNSSPYIVNENAGPVEIILMLDQPSCGPITIVARPQERSSSASRDDFDGTPVRVTIDPGETTITVSIPIIDDNLLEAVEVFDVEFTVRNQNTAGARMGQPNVIPVAISSEDVVIASFTQQEYTVREDARSMIVGVQLDREPQQRIAVQVLLLGISAEGNGIDFISTRRVAVFRNRIVVRNVSIPIINDDIVEPRELFMLSIQIQRQFVSLGVARGIPATANGFIIDDDVDCGDPERPDNGSVSFISTREESVANYSCNEGYNLTGIIQRVCQINGSWSGVVPTCQIVDCGSPGIPTNGLTDVIMTTFGSVVNHSCVDNFLLCGSESRTCQANGLWSGSLPVCILVTITLGDTTYLVSEDDGFVQIKVVLDQPSCLPINISVQPRIHMFGDPDNIASEDDFDISEKAAVFNPGEIETTIFISITNDSILEQDELFDIVLTNSTDTGVQVGMPRVAGVSIMNTDMLTVMFSQQSYSVDESDGQVTVGLEFSRTAGRDVTIGIRAIPNTAQGNNLDFDSTRRTVTFGPSDMHILFNVSIVNDAVLELEENFTLSIQISRAQVRIGVELGDPSETVVVINDDDEIMFVEFEQSSYTINEKAGQIEVCLLSNGQNNANIFVFIQPQETVPVSARALHDFEDNVSSVQFSPGEVRSCYSQKIIDDTVPEYFEMFDLVILMNSQIVIGNRSLLQITIIDDDIKGNDTIIGDPLYTVPLQISPEMIVANPEIANLSLCYEIHGSANGFFNLVSDQCVSITAEYHQSVVDHSLNFIGKIGVLAVDNDGDCQHITVDGNGCVASVGSTEVTQAAPYNNSGIKVRRNKRYYRIAVPNCELQDLIVWAVCEDKNALRFIIARGFNLQPTSHGLVAQFWNVPVELTQFTGPTPDNDTYYTVKVTPADGDVREFIGSLFTLTWDYTRAPCLYVGNQQGGTVIEFLDFSDSVIEGFYWEYAVSGLFGTEFVYSQFNNSQCVP